MYSFLLRDIKDLSLMKFFLQLSYYIVKEPIKLFSVEKIKLRIAPNSLKSGNKYNREYSYMKTQNTLRACEGK